MIDADTDCRISSPSAGSSTARASTTAPTMPAKGASAFSPIGATGAILITKAAHALHRLGQSKAVVSLCIGGGQGIAICVERT